MSTLVLPVHRRKEEDGDDHRGGPAQGFAHGDRPYPATNTKEPSLRIEATLAGYRQLLRWGRAFPERRWAIENARGLGRRLAQWLVVRGEDVVDVPATATARVHELSRGGRRKNNVVDSSAAARVAARQVDEGKSHNEAMRCLKRGLASHVWQTMRADEPLRRFREEQASAAA